MADGKRQIIAIGGGGFYRDPENLHLERYIIQQRAVDAARVAFVPTASAEPDSSLVSFYTAFLKLGCRPSYLSFFKRAPDLRAFLLSQDIIFIGGGNTKSSAETHREVRCRLRRLTLIGTSRKGIRIDKRRELANMKLHKKMPIVGAVMTSFPYFVETNEPVSRIEHLMDEHHIRHVPVQENGKVVGVVTERDLHHVIKRSASLEEKEKVRARDIMVVNPYVVAFNTPLSEVVTGMAQRHIGSAIVVRRGKLAGILSSIDVCRILAEFLESTFPSATGDDAA